MPEEKDPRTVLITGGNRGIGKAIALTLASAGYNIAFTYNSGPVEASRVSKEILNLGVDARSYRVNLASRTDLEGFTTRMKAEGGSIFTIVNNAGIYRGTRLNETQDEEWEKVIGLNLSAPFYLSRDLNGIISDGGSIVNISSVYGLRADPWAHGYQASKAALIHLTRGLAKELAPRIRVNAVAPGYIRTDLNREGWENEAFSAKISKMTPMLRWGEPEDVALAVKFLIDPDNSFINGHTLVVDGGIGL